MKRGLFFVVIPVIFSILFLSVVSADIFVDDLHSLYNVGDVVRANVTIGSSVETAGFFTTFLVCGASEIENFKSMEILEAGEQKVLSVVAIIDEGLVGVLGGECFIRALYGSGEARSQPFRISRGISVVIDSGVAVFDPGIVMNISGTAVKDNRNSLNGFVEIVVEGVDVSLPDPSFNLDNFEDDEVVHGVDETIGNDSEDGDEIEDSLDEEGSEDFDSEEDSEDEDEDSEDNDGDEQIGEESVVVTENKTVIIGSLSGTVVNGSFSASFLIPDDAPPGNYNIKVRVYDLSRHGVLMNEGLAVSSVRVTQIIKSLSLSLSQGSITPGNSLLYNSGVFDQAGNLGEGDIEVNLYQPDKSLFYGRVVKSGVEQSFFVSANTTPGFWELEAKHAEFEQTVVFYVEELPIISSSLESGMLVITNTGNAVYKGPVEIGIGNRTEVRNVNLEVGESVRYALEAPDGEYSITVNDGSGSRSLGKTFLTGNAIGINSVGGVLFGSIGLWIWSFLIVVLIIVVLVLARKIFKKRFIGKVPKTVTPSASSKLNNSEVVSSSQVSANNKFSPTVNQQSKSRSNSISAVPGKLLNSPSSISPGDNVMDKGSKQEVSVIALKINNLENLRNSSRVNGSPLVTVDTALLKAKSARAKIYVDGDYRIAILAPSSTKTYDNSLSAITVAKEMEELIRNYNRSTSEKIDFGLSVHSGQMGVEKEGEKLKFVSLEECKVTK